MINLKNLLRKITLLPGNIMNKLQKIPNLVMKNYVMLVLLLAIIVLLYFTAIIKLSN